MKIFKRPKGKITYIKDDPLLRDAITQMRFGSRIFSRNSTPFFNYKTIAEATGVSVSYVRRLIEESLSATAHCGTSGRSRRSKLSQQHVAFLVSEATLS
jgi:hypothetical protein